MISGHMLQEAGQALFYEQQHQMLPGDRSLAMIYYNSFHRAREVCCLSLWLAIL